LFLRPAEVDAIAAIQRLLAGIDQRDRSAAVRRIDDHLPR
jgi:hypothetical protein